MDGAGGTHLVLYDGVCALCNRFVTFILKRDREGRFRFAAAQGALAASLMKPRGISPGDLDTMWVITGRGRGGERVLSRGRAALFILDELGGGWRLFARAAGVLPDVLLNFGYGLVASNRYRVWGRYDSCPIPPPEWRDRFVG